MVRPGEKVWTEHTTPFDRVQAIVLGVSETRSVEYIAEEAAVSVETARNRDEYGVDSPKALRGHGDATDSPQDTDCLHERANEWELVEYRLSVVTDAIDSYQQFD